MAPKQADSCPPTKKRKFGHTDTRDQVKMQREVLHLHAQEAGLRRNGPERRAACHVSTPVRGPLLLGPALLMRFPDDGMGAAQAGSRLHATGFPWTFTCA